MRAVRIHRLLACAVAALVLAPGAGAAELKRPPVTWLKGEGNFTKAHRMPKSIRRIVVHSTEGSFWGSITWLKSERSHASAHYIVSRRGRIVQIVHQSDIAWHAGNWKTNVLSVGIEHEGVTDDPAGFTDAQYRSSAQLAAYIARQSVMPIDRGHFIAHADVPDPRNPALRGGSTHHTDPGKYWNWRRYLRLVRAYAAPAKPKPKPKPKPVPKPVPKPAQPKPKPQPPKPKPQPPKPRPTLSVASSTVYDGQTVRGTVPWRAAANGPGIVRVDFVVGGRVRWSDRRAPFAFADGRGWSTTSLPNGRHVLELRAYGRGGAWTRTRMTVKVDNLPFVLRAPALPAQLTGRVKVAPRLAGPKVRRVELWLDGKRIDHDTSVPFVFPWDTRRLADGPHVLEVRAWAVDGRAKSLRLAVAVTNELAASKPAVVGQTLVEGQTVTGLVDWSAEVRGSVQKVEFLVDGAVRGTASSSPYTFRWDTAAESPGRHRITVRAVGAAAARAESSLNVTVAGA